MKILTTGQCAKLCQVAPQTVAKWFDTGRLKGFNVPGSRDRRIPQDQLVKFMKEYGLPIPDELQITARDPYAAAGELFGHLRKALGFGDLSMSTPPPFLRDPGSLAFQWSFNAGGKRYHCEEMLLLVELEHTQDIEGWAKYLATVWKDLHREHSEKQS